MKAKGYGTEGFLTSFLACLMLVFACGLQGCEGKGAGKSSSGGGGVQPVSYSRQETSSMPARDGEAGSPAASSGASDPEARLPFPGRRPFFPVPDREPASASETPRIPPAGGHPGHGNAWGGSAASGLDMELFGPGGTVVFRNPAFPLGDVPMHKIPEEAGLASAAETGAGQEAGPEARP